MAINCEEKQLRVGDVGTHLEIEVLEDCNVPLDISTASVKDITIQRPDKTTVVKNGIFTTDGTDGKVYFLTAAGDLNIEGTYSIQIYLELPTWQGYSCIDEFEVHDNLG